MRVLLHSGLVLVLGVFVARSFAQEVQWRPASNPPASSAADNPNGLTLGRPVPLEDPAAAEVEAVQFRPAGALVRAKGDTPRPLPNGPPLNPELIRIIEDPVSIGGQKDDIKKDKESIPFAPKVLNNGPRAETMSSGSSPVCCGERLICTDCCWDSCCVGCCEPCCLPRPRFWLSAEYLGWNIADQHIPPLVTTSPTGTAIVDAGVLGAPGTRVLFDQDTMLNDMRNGGRFTLGFWLPRYCDLGLETSYFFLGRRGNSFTASSTGDPILARPIFDVVGGTEVSQLVAFPGVVSGTINVDYDTRLWGIDFAFRHKLWCTPRSWVDLIYGYRHMQLEDNVNIAESLSAVQAGGPLGILVQDSFATRNVFNGFLLGIEGERKLLRRWFVGAYGKIALGDNHEIININGSTTFSAVAPGVANPQPAGILALPTNIGHHSRHRFAAIPEIGVKFGYELNDHFRIWVGWSGLWFSDTVRAGENIDRGINRTQLPNNVTGIGRLVGEPRPAVLFRDQTFWANGLTAGLEYRY